MRYISITGCTGNTRPLGGGKVTKKGGANFGPRAGDEKFSSSSSLKKSAKESLAPAERFTYTDIEKPRVPTQEDKPVFGIQSTKNFITANAVEAILQGINVIAFEIS